MQIFKIITLGCKVNQCESQLLREQLNGQGLREAAPGENADLCIVNTCAVTATAQSKSLKALRKLERENSAARMVAIGCGVTAAAERYTEADLLVPQDKKSDAIFRILGVESPVVTASSFCGHARAFLKVQDGCDSFCAYCIVPYLRGRPRSRPLEEIEREARAFAASGYKELVICGTNLGLYGKDAPEGPDLSGLVEGLLELDLFPRIRLSGIEVTEIDRRLIALLTQENALCPHMHIPIQSGSDSVLRDMGRNYTVGEYLGVVDSLRRGDNRVAITTDVIVGFPTEGPEEFEETMQTVRRAAFSRLHVFPYSRREGTAAAQKWNSGPARETSLRSKELIALGAELAESYSALFDGETVRVIAESSAPNGALTGYTDYYVRANVRGAGIPLGSLVEGTARSGKKGFLSVTPCAGTPALLRRYD